MNDRKRRERARRLSDARKRATVATFSPECYQKDFSEAPIAKMYGMPWQHPTVRDEEDWERSLTRVG